jgi:hypothetical protein
VSYDDWNQDAADLLARLDACVAFMDGKGPPPPCRAEPSDPIQPSEARQVWRCIWAPVLEMLPEPWRERVRTPDELLLQVAARRDGEGRILPALVYDDSEARYWRDGEAWQAVAGEGDPPWPALEDWRRRLAEGGWPVEVEGLTDGAARWLLAEYGEAQ